MALTRKLLSAMGLEDEKIEEIINAHTETVNALKEDRDNFKADAAKLPGVQKELDDAKKAMENGDKSPYKVKYEAIVEEKEALQKEFDDYKSAQAAKETAAAKANAFRALLKEAGVSEKRIEAVLKVSDTGGIEIGDDGKAKDADKLIEGIKSEWSEFIVVEGQQGANTATPPGNTGGNTFEAMSLSEKMAYANDHPEDESVKSWLAK